MQKFRFYSLTLLFLTVIMACEDDPAVPSDCGERVVISASGYDSAHQDGTIISASIEGDCLLIEFGASGCSAGNWLIALYDANAIMESLPVQRNLIFSLKNEQACQAYFEQEITFDISPLQLPEYNEILLNLDEYGQLSYKY